ncbi:MAG: hypothetical protein Q4C64_00390 [Erysipelotrichia bacterium]|nr:hypothetical protein [Erysipelotrichia bacterium]
MEFKLQNEKIMLTASSKAAEIISLKKIDGQEMIWDRNKEDWHNCNPILFPIVGPLANNQYEYEGNTYTLTQHGFLRRSEFKFEEIKKDEMTLSFTANDESKKLYPFDFKITVNYCLNDNKVLLNYTIYNLDNKDLPFEIGFHPAFNCPNIYDKNFSDWYVEFEKEETFGQKLPLSTIINAEKNQTFYHNELNSTYVSVTNGSQGIRIGIEGYNVLGFWHKRPEAEFICIEPQFPKNNLESNNFFQRENKINLLLKPNCSFNCSYYWQVL